MKLCNVPQDLLAKQAVIDCVPSIVWLGMIVTILVAAYYYVYFIDRNKLVNSKDLVSCITALIVMTIMGMGIGAMLLKTILTAIFNPEYAAMVKFAAECVK